MTATTSTPAATDDRVWDPCGKCGGDGVVHYGNVVYTTRRGPERTCHRCNGARGRWTTQAAIDKRNRRRERAAERANEKARAAAIEAAAKLAAAQDAFAAENPDVIAALPTLPGEFGASTRASYEEFGTLTAKQIEAVLRIAAEKAAEPTPAPVVEGKIRVTGKIVSMKWQDSAYGPGGSLKMVVLDDRGFKVWGTVPRALEGVGQYFDEDADETRFDGGVERGDRVSFTATVEVSDRDETFGFFKRPTKAERL